MTRMPWSTLAALALAGCVPVAGASGSLLVLVLLAASLGLTSVVRRASAGAPVPCTGTEIPSCSSGRVQRHCCPAGASCNFRSPPYVDCGGGTCALGADRGRCPVPVPYLTKDDEKTCRKESWQEVCLDHKVTRACISSYPTNYTGPSFNPTFRRCMADRCTTSPFLEDCFPTRDELRGQPTSCAGAWRKVCLGGKVRERCAPPQRPGTDLPATTYTLCKDGSCVVGSDASVCPR